MTVKLKLISGDKVYEAEPVVIPQAKLGGFPQKKTRKIGLWPFRKTVEENDGWEDLGPKNDFSIEGKEGKWRTVHNVCCDTVHVGRECDDLFTFCPRCMVKM